MLADNVQEELEKRYAEEKRRQAKIANTTREKIGNFVQAILDKPSTTEQSQLAAPTSEPDPPPSNETAEV